jgi:hypothetical protein
MIFAIIYLYIIGFIFAFLTAAVEHKAHQGNEDVYPAFVAAIPWPIRLPIFLIKVIAWVLVFLALYGTTLLWDICVVIKNDFKWFKC